MLKPSYNLMPICSFLPYKQESQNHFMLQNVCLPQSEHTFTGRNENDFYITDVEMSETIIMLAQVDQALCDEVENGHINGKGMYRNGCWISDDGSCQINVQQNWYYFGGNIPTRDGGLSPSAGQPCIETVFYGIPANVNASWEWNTMWLYLRMAGGKLPFSEPRLIGGATGYEADLAITFCEKFGLSGCWGGKNRVSTTAHWKEDKSVLNTYIDAGWQRFEVKNNQGVPLHNVIVQIQNDKAIILPETILHRSDFGARRVFWLSEAVHYPIKFGRFKSGVINVTLSYPKELNSDDGWLIYPGGANAVRISDLTLIRNARKVNLLLIAKQGESGWKFAMIFAARLLKENICTFSINFLSGTNIQKLSLKKFRKELQELRLSIPEELSDSFRGNLDTFITRKHPELIPGVLNRGAVLLVSGAFCPEVAFYLAISVKYGCWDGRWRSAKRGCKVTLLADKYRLFKLEKTKLPTGVNVRSGNLSLADSIEILRDSELVIFASEYLENDKGRYRELLKLCLDRNVTSIVFSSKPEDFVLQTASQFYTLNCQLDETVRQYIFCSAEALFGVRFTLNQQGQLASCYDLRETELNQYCGIQNTFQVSNGTENISNIPKDQIISTIFGEKPF